jgi:hypothetical protein
MESSEQRSGRASCGCRTNFPDDTVRGTDSRGEGEKKDGAMFTTEKGPVNGKAGNRAGRG